MRILAYVAVGLWSCNTAFAESSMVSAAKECMPIIAKDKFVGSRSVSTTLFLLDFTSEDEFKNAKTAAAGSATFIYGGLVVPATATWEQFNEQKSSYKQNHQINYSNTTNESWFVERVNPDGYTAYISCLKELRQKSEGVYVTFSFTKDEYGNPNYAHGTIHVSAVIGASGRRVLRLYTSAGQILRPAGLQIETDGPDVFEGTRDPKGRISVPFEQLLEQDFDYQRNEIAQSSIVYANVSDYYKNDSVEIAPQPKTYRETGLETEFVGPPALATSYKGSGEELHSIACVSSYSGNWKLTGNPRFKEQLGRFSTGGCEDCTRDSEQITESSTKQMCQQFHSKVYTDKGGTVSSTLAATAAQFDWLPE